MATFTSKISETLVLNGNNVGSSVTYTNENVNFVDNRFLNIPTGSQTTIFSLSNIPGAGQFTTSSLVYARITNISTTVPIQLNVTSSNIRTTFLISTGSSFLLSTSKITGSVDNTFTLEDIRSINVQPSGSSATIEYYIATT
jgi:hypothetical protein